MIFFKFFIFFEKYFFKKSSRLVKVIFAAIDKSATWKFFSLWKSGDIGCLSTQFCTDGRGSTCPWHRVFRRKIVFCLFQLVIYTTKNDSRPLRAWSSNISTLWKSLPCNPCNPWNPGKNGKHVEILRVFEILEHSATPETHETPFSTPGNFRTIRLWLVQFCWLLRTRCCIWVWLRGGLVFELVLWIFALPNPSVGIINLDPQHLGGHLL